MPTTNRRTQPTKKVRVANRRDLIIKTAARLFREKGFEGTTVRDLAEAVDMQSGSLFFHFKSKDEILQAVLEEGLDRAVATLDRALTEARTPREKLSAIFHAHLKAILGEERDAFTVVLRDWRALSPSLRRKIIAHRDKYEAHLGSALDELSEAKLVPHDTHLLRLFLLGALNWTVQWYRQGGELSIDELAEGFLKLVLPTEGSKGGRRLKSPRA